MTTMEPDEIIRERQQDASEARCVIWTHESELRPEYDPVVDLVVQYPASAYYVVSTCQHCGAEAARDVCKVSPQGFIAPRVMIGNSKCGCGCTLFHVVLEPVPDDLDHDDGTGRHPTNPPEITEP